MATATNNRQLREQKEQTPVPTAAQFRDKTAKTAMSLLVGWVGPDRAAEATGRIATAISTAAATSKKPEEFYRCDPRSVGAVVAMAALTGIMVGTGATALAYAIPRRARKGEEPQLTYQLSHRGINALASRADQMMIALPIGMQDQIEVDDSGEVIVKYRDIDNPPTCEEELRGIVLVVKRASSGSVIYRGYVAKTLINKRRDTSDSYIYAEKPENNWAKSNSTWHQWYVEMAQKTAMHYAIGRGWCIIDDTDAARALSADVEADVVSVDAIHHERIESKPIGMKALTERLGIDEDAGQEAESDLQADAVIDASNTSEQQQKSTLAEQFLAKINTSVTAKRLNEIKGEVMESALNGAEKSALSAEINDKLEVLAEMDGN